MHPGPGHNTPAFVRGLVAAGTSIFRINFSHGTPDEHARAAGLVREAEAEAGRALAVLADLPGPKVRLGTMDPDPFRFVPGQTFDLRPEGDGDERGASTTYPELADDLREGDRVLLADGAVELAVTRSTVHAVRIAVRARRHRSIGAGRQRARPSVSACPPSPTATGRAWSRALDMDVDLIAQSFVRGPDDIEELRTLMGDRVVPIVAKIETKPAIENVDAILGVTDALMVARGDLGVELPMEQIPSLQKDLLRAARGAGRPVIVATQMLESMIRSPRPTRAEATDVANAVLDGADGIMLSGETAIGEYPFEAAAAASRIAAAVEQRAGSTARCSRRARTRARPPRWPMPSRASRRPDREVVAITCYTETGRTARLLSAERPSCPIFAFMPDAAVRRANTLTGVSCRCLGPPGRYGRDDRAHGRGLQEHGLARPGQLGRHGGGLTGGSNHHQHAEAAPVGGPLTLGNGAWVRTAPR